MKQGVKRLIVFLLKKVHLWNLVNSHFSLKKYRVTKHPRSVTAVIPNYNYANYLEARVNSIVNQTYPVSELIILDDKSTDDSLKVIDRIVKNLKTVRPNLKVRFIPNEVNSGKVFKQWAKAFAEATGDYLWICEADDLCSKHFLNAVMQGFEKNEKVVLSYAESKMIDDEGYTLMPNFRPWIDYLASGHWKKSYINDGKNELKTVTAVNNTITNVSGVVFKLRENGKNILPYQDYLKKAMDFRLAGDWYFYAKILAHGSIAYEAESLNFYRSHLGSVSKTTDNFTHYREIVAVQDEIAKDVDLPAIMKKHIKRRRQELIRMWGLSEELILLNEPLPNSSKTLLSVIIPVYNVEKYLKTCLNSVFANFPKHSEVIIINDASPDKSEKIILEYMKLHPEIKYKKLTKNLGLSGARNAGLELATGEYITFLDPDDYVTVNAYSTMLKKAIKTNSELVCSDIMVVYPPQPNHHDPLAVEPRKVWSSAVNESHQDLLMQILDTDLMASACNKMFKRSLFDGVTFPEGINNEDVAIIPLLTARAQNLVHIKTPYYNYIQRKTSIQGNGGVFNKNRLVIFKTVALCLESAKSLPKPIIDKIEGALIPHQLLVILIYTISDLRDKTERRKYIQLFCEKFNQLDFNRKNHYTCDFLGTVSMPKLIDLISSSKTATLDRYIRKSRHLQALKNSLRRFKR